MEEQKDHRLAVRRREAIAAIGGVLGAAGLALWRGPREALFGDDETTTAEAARRNQCVLTPEETEGPYYIADEPFRRDITEGHAGAPLQLNLKVQDARTCKPIRKASVEIWHADAAGDYSGFGNATANRTFLRGQQRTNKKGIATFDTIYPGWYRGRTPHIHVKVHVKGRTVHTGQVFFDDSVSDAVYAQAAYSGRGTRETRNSNDGIFGNTGSKTTVTLSPAGSGYSGRMNLGVQA